MTYHIDLKASWTLEDLMYNIQKFSKSFLKNNNNFVKQVTKIVEWTQLDWLNCTLETSCDMALIKF